MTTNLWTYVLAWFPMVVLTLVIGVVRDLTYGKNLDEEPARRVSVGIAFFVLGLYIAALAMLMPFDEPRQALVVGGIWVGITLAFDSLMKFVMPAPARSSGADDLFSGPSQRRSPIGIVLVVWLGIAPWLFDQLFWRL